jgi:hypothetical protein
MTISEKLIKETGESVHLYKEGVFWVAYEKSAFALSNYKSLKVTKKYIKAINGEIVRVGFPSGILTFFYSKLGEPVVKEDFYIQIDLTNTIQPEEFESWKSEQKMENVPLHPKIKMESDFEEATIPENYILRLISSYPLAEKTPLETMMFVGEVKQLIKGYI